STNQCFLTCSKQHSRQRLARNAQQPRRTSERNEEAANGCSSRQAFAAADVRLEDVDGLNNSSPKALRHAPCLAHERAKRLVLFLLEGRAGKAADKPVRRPTLEGLKHPAEAVDFRRGSSEPVQRVIQRNVPRALESCLLSCKPS